MTESEEAKELNKRIENLREAIEKRKRQVQWDIDNPKVWNDGGKRRREGEQFIRENEQLLGYLEELRELKEKANDVCKWEDESRHVVCGHGQIEYRYKVRDWSFCPYCGKKAMVNDWSEGKG